MAKENGLNKLADSDKTLLKAVAAQAASPVPRLRCVGEKFMRMFDDADSDADVADLSQSSGQSSSDSEPDGGYESNMEEKPHMSEEDERIDPKKVKIVEVMYQKPKNKVAPPLSGREMRKAKRQFLTGKSSMIHADVKAQPSIEVKKAKSSGSGEGEEDIMSRKALQKMHEEVVLFGASGLHKRDRKKIEDARLTKLHAQIDKHHRLPANIGRGHAAHRAELEKKKLQEDIDSGMVIQKGMGKRKKRIASMEKRRSAGLVEDGGAFRNGILHVKHVRGAKKLTIKKTK